MGGGVGGHKEDQGVGLCVTQPIICHQLSVQLFVSLLKLQNIFFATQEAANGRSDAGKMEGAKKAGSKLSVERVYQKKTQLEHILLRPDTYIGSVEPITQVRVASFQFLSHAGAI